jgi:hypothetical protein
MATSRSSCVSPCAIDLAHAALAQERDDLVRAESGSGRQRHAGLHYRRARVHSASIRPNAVENVNAQVDELIATGVLRLLAFTELKFSNPMIEAWWRSTSTNMTTCFRIRLSRTDARRDALRTSTFRRRRDDGRVGHGTRHRNHLVTTRKCAKAGMSRTARRFWGDAVGAYQCGTRILPLAI